MILRRVIEHVRHQQWTAIGIDLVIVILGVFIGTQVSNWNASRLEDVRAQGYLRRIDDNIRSDLVAIDRRSVYWKQVNDYGRAAIRYSETGELAEGSAWKTVLAFYQASQFWPWVPYDSTYQELRSGGELALIRDDALRTELGRYYIEASGTNVGYLFATAPEYRKIVRGLTPAVVSEQVWSHCWKLPNEGEQYLLDCDAPLSEDAARAVLDGYMKDPRLLSELRFWVTNQEVSLAVVRNTRVLAERIVARMHGGNGRAP